MLTNHFRGNERRKKCFRKNFFGPCLAWRHAQYILHHNKSKLNADEVRSERYSRRSLTSLWVQNVHM